ncbi:other/FunK1 protein kinase [Coprinopsis cinerea okayama7|uniref:Other/FunK1 protein kinase n=1 Tax=Coprinopsis cinerea (strain Okayama-7 / 130 / ATCC MYA-4618 / FGSC 9003) TaxID=240176 RepID=A8PD57_COPC7|nr:other/FunK1 protein kinase [Coprinopsis cinerea okayama7\|eukprot:XP_001840538.1 other/FunK1 protein kinase [Coprinopsis cinerea okayama7\
MKPTFFQCSYEQLMARYFPKPAHPPEFNLDDSLTRMRDRVQRNDGGDEEGEEKNENVNDEEEEEEEEDIRDLLQTTVNSSWLEGTGFAIVLSKAYKPDSSLHPKTRINGGLYKINEAPSKDERPDYETLEVGIGVVPPDRKDFFDDFVGQPFASAPPASQEALEQAKSYSLIPFVFQHRTHHYTVFIFGSLARIVRWDRAGFVFTEAFNYLNYPELLGDFLWRYIHLSPTDRGFDATVERVLSETPDWHLIQRRADTPRKLKGHDVDEHVRMLFQETIRTGRRYKLSVQGRYFLIGQPHIRSPVASSRGTRGYIAIDTMNPDGPFVFLKDTWRVLRGDLRKEGDVLLDLNTPEEEPQRGRKYIPTLVSHGDVEGGWQKTDSQDFWAELNHPDSSKTCPLKTHQHYRLVVKEVGLPITEFKNGREMLTIILHGVAAHGYAHKKGYMHRDISVGNILIFVRADVEEGRLKEERHGLLTDWELAEKLTDQGPRHLERTGTWQFLAIDILDNPSKPVEVWHEMESWFHLTLWLAVQYLPHNVQNVAVFMSDFFDDAAKPYDGSTHQKCGTLKRTSMETGRICFADGTHFKFGAQDDPFVPHAINKVLAQLARAFSYRYQELLRANAPPWLEVDVADPTPAQIKALENIGDQVRFEELLVECLNGPGWPEDDKTEPQVSLC